MAHIIFCFNILIICTFLNNCYSFSQDYIMGYVSCIISDLIPEEALDFHLENERLHIHLLKRDLDPSTKEKLLQRLKKTKLFKCVDITVADAQLPYAQTGVACSLNSHTSQPSHEILPSDVIYDPPIADPKWPKFSVGYQKHFKNTYGKRIFDLSFGENVPLIRYKTDGWAYELGLQAGLFGLMDVDSSPTRLINSDYFVGGGLSLDSVVTR